MSDLWKNDEELFELARRELFTAVIGDVLDRMGLLQQFLPPQIRPLRDEMVIIGRAMTVLEANCLDHPEGSSANPVMRTPFGLMLDALDNLQPNEVYLCTGSAADYALWGELMSMRAIRCGAVGAVMHGYHRDTQGVLKLNFPTFSWGPYAKDQTARGKVIDYRCPVDIEGVTANDGDIVFGDIDGVVMIPREAEEEAFHKALEKVRGEKLVMKCLEDGMTAREAFDKYGIL